MVNDIIYQNARLLSGGRIIDGHELHCRNGKIVGIFPQTASNPKAIDLKGAYLAPGFIDLHCHGAIGEEFIDGNEQAFLKICEFHAAHGTRVLYPTISACDFSTMYHALEAAEQVIAQSPITIPGIHLEGPYLAPEMCGAQDTSYITPPIQKEYSTIIERFGHIIARWTYAPERDDGSFLTALNAAHITPSIGHSAAEYKDVLLAHQNGCQLITHLYSCTSTITRKSGFRHLGIIESAYLLDSMYVEAIADGCHLPPELLRMIVKIKGADRVCLITDAIRPAGLAPSSDIVGTKNVPYLIEDGVAKLTDRSAFAGSIATTDILLRKTVEAGIPVEKTVQMLTQTPAEVMGLLTKGSLLPGYDADFTIFDEDFNIIDWKVLKD